ncbi:MAG: hypothetical protein RI562_09025 [Salibacter sp.]|jgi:hypothetical protein|uniref:DUF6952 family protein n=1 Tax=Salibacter sp. TaxID=2010995 RepID=UPI00287081E3|nr:hypothetical protein [Salibacter sp.]MDR9399192.1 hypothetical protein [Salibacter sp.]
MRLPIIKQLVKDGSFDEDYMEEAVEVLLSVAEAPGIKDEESEVIGELVSNIEGAKVVLTDIRENGTPQKEALNSFMQRVMGAVK